MISLKLKIYGIILYSVGDSITDAVIKKCYYILCSRDSEYRSTHWTRCKCCLEHKQAKKYRY